MKTLHNLGHNIFWLTFEKRYDLCMTFWRIAETRESPCPNIKNGITLVDFMEWYAEKYGEGAFTYANDWAGYNVSHEDFKKTYSSHNITDYNKYDKFMHGLRHFIESTLQKDTDNYYLIGTQEEDFSTLRHEYAHALWAMNPEYRQKQENLLKAVDPEIQSVICNNLQEMGYVADVHSDEAQAYLSTGFILKKKDAFYKPLNKRIIDQIAKSFIDVFVEFSQGRLPGKKI